VSGVGYFSSSVTGDGFYVGSANIGNAAYVIDDSSNGSSSATLYIGNASITVSSDKRIKKDIEDSKLNALETIGKFRLVDFFWDDPTDTSFNNRNVRGKWTGIIAQEVVEHFPTIVNAPRKEENLSIDWESESRWNLDNGAAMGLMLKAIQELSAKVTALEEKIA
jgi:hypothetical protein